MKTVQFAAFALLFLGTCSFGQIPPDTKTKLRGAQKTPLANGTTLDLAFDPDTVALLRKWSDCLSLIDLRNTTPLPISYTDYLHILRDRADVNRCFNITKTTEQNLIYYLLYNHKAWTRPVYRASKVMTVNASIFLTSIYDVSWVDELLKWDPADFGGVQSVRIPCHLLWTPDIILVNTYNGEAYWLPPARFRSTCPLDVTWFPYDDQKCYLIFGSSSYDGTEIKLTYYRDSQFVREYVESGKFILVSIKQEVVEVDYPSRESFIVYQLHVRRRTLYYVYSSMLPCIFLSILTATVFLAPPASNQKVNLGITTLLSLYVYSSMLAEKMPEISDSVPLLGVYISMVTMFTTVSLVSTVFILGIYDRDFGAYPPYCLDRLAVAIGRGICMNVPYWENFLMIHSKSTQYKRKLSHTFSFDPTPIRKIRCDCSRCRDSNQEARLQQIKEEIVNVLEATEAFHEKAEESELTKAWKRIAMIIDRLLLIVFSLLVVASILLFLVLAPLFQQLDTGKNWWEIPFDEK